MEILRKRYKYYLVTYIIFYIISLIGTGISNIYYLIPIKIFPVCMTLLIANISYYTIEEKNDRFLATFRSLKYIFICILILIVFTPLQVYLLERYGVDITPFIGIK